MKGSTPEPGPRWILLSVLALLAVVAALAVLEEPPGIGGEAHPDLSTMRRGGPASARAEMILPGWILGCAVILCFSALIHFGALRGRGREGLALLLRWVTVLYLLAWSWLVWTYRGSLEAADPALVLAMPPATAIMLWVLWPISMLFSALFVLGFERWVLTRDEEAAFDRLVARFRETGSAPED